LFYFSLIFNLKSSLSGFNSFLYHKNQKLRQKVWITAKKDQKFRGKITS